MPRVKNDPEHEGTPRKLFRARPKGDDVKFNPRDLLVNAAGIAAVTRIVVEHGDAVSFSLTSDGGQLCITRLHDREPSKCYVPKEASLPAALQELASEYGADYVQVLRVALSINPGEQEQLPFE